MPRRSNEPPKAKIRAEFARRLARLASEAMARALALIDTGIAPAAATGRPSKESRKAIAEAIGTAATPALAEVDHLLEHSGGRRLSPARTCSAPSPSMRRPWHC